MGSPFVVKRSNIEGRGVFAARDIKKGETITRMRGVSKNFKQLARIWKSGDKRMGVDPFKIGAHSYILLQDPYNYINHSREPNAAVQGKDTLVAVRRIKKGEEILYDYSATEWTPHDYPPYYGDEWPMRCECGSPRCRKWVACFYYLPKSTQRRYLKSGMIQDYIVKKAAGPEAKKHCVMCEAGLARKSVDIKALAH